MSISRLDQINTNIEKGWFKLVTMKNTTPKSKVDLKPVTVTLDTPNRQHSLFVEVPVTFCFKMFTNFVKV